MPKEGQVLSPKVKQQLDGYAAKLRAQWETEKSTLSKKWDLRPRTFEGNGTSTQTLNEDI